MKFNFPCEGTRDLEIGQKCVGLTLMRSRPISITLDSADIKKLIMYIHEDKDKSMKWFDSIYKTLKEF